MIDRFCYKFFGLLDRYITFLDKTFFPRNKKCKCGGKCKCK